MWLALILAATAAPSPSPKATLPPCVSDAQVAAHIDPRLPKWMRVEIRTVMLSLPPCARRGSVGADDSQGRFITNTYGDYLAYQKEWGGDWTRVNSQFWRAPSGDLIKMPYEPVPSWLIGQWSCKAKDATPPLMLVLRPNDTGAVRYGAARVIPIQLYAYRAWPLPTIYAGIKSNGLAYSVKQAPNGIAITNWGFFRDDTWNAMTMQSQWLCTRVGSVK